MKLASEGVRRLLIVTVAPWLVAWAVVFALTAYRLTELHRFNVTAITEYGHPTFAGEQDIAKDNMSDIADAIVATRPWPYIAIWAGVGGAAAWVSAVVGALWVRQGFRSEQNSN